MSIITAIDLGSNSFRVLIYDCKKEIILAEHNEVVGMADGLTHTGCISKEAQERVVFAINTTSQNMNYDTNKAICVTTAAMRLAKNSKDVLAYLKEKTGANFVIIDGHEEARLTLLAVKHALKREKIPSNNFILLDIGGGSLEIIVNTKNEYISHSFNFGIVTLTQKHYKEKELKDFLENRKKEINNFLSSLDLDYKKYSFVATAGTPTTIAAMKLGQDFFNYNKNEVNGSIVNLDDLDTALNIFKNASKNEIRKLVGEGRVDFIEIGIYIYRAIFEVLNKNESIVLDDGLREGVALNYASKKAI